MFDFRRPLSLLFVLCTTTAVSASDSTDKLVEQYETKIKPILTDHCVRCHGAAKQSSGLDLRDLPRLLAGSDSGAIIDASDPKSSRLAMVVAENADPQMPPEDPLDDKDRAILLAWVNHFRNADIESLTNELESKSEPSEPVQPDPTFAAGVAPRLVIDLEIQAGWNATQTPTEICDDPTFVRRIYLDLCGRIPTRQEREDFLANTNSQKRQQLIDRLLESDEHARHLADVFDAVLMGRESKNVLRKRHQHGWRGYLQRSFAENKPWDQMAGEILLARPADKSDAGSIWYLYERDNQHQQIAEAVARGIFGVQIDCAQCHDHPLAAEIKQSHYWGLVAFFNRGNNVEAAGSPRVAESAVGGFAMFTNLEGESQPNRLRFLDSDEVPEQRPKEGEKQADRDELYLQPEGSQPKVPRFSRREAFVQQVLKDHPRVSKAMVNRLWAWCMGRGIVHPVDAIDSTHPPSHPRLLQWLSTDFAENGYDIRRTLREIVSSRSYQLSSQSDDFIDPAKFRIAATKPLTAEMLFRSTLVALEIPLPDQQAMIDQADALRNTFPDVMSEISLGNLRQALLLSNGPDIHSLLSPDRSPLVARLVKQKTPRDVVPTAFRQVLGREADKAEMKRSVEYLRDRQDQDEHGIPSFVWALLTSAEFRFNH